MKTRSVQDSRQEDFEPGPPPVMAGDGLPMQAYGSPADLDVPPRLCEQGPCKHYHCFSIQMDAGRPIAARVGPKGELEGNPEPAAIHTESHHYCYPDAGIEFELGETPVITCSRWTPMLYPDREEVEERREAFSRSREGKAYETALDAWRARQEEIRDADARAVAEAAEEMKQAEIEREQAKIDRDLDASAGIGACPKCGRFDNRHICGGCGRFDCECDGHFKEDAPDTTTTQPETITKEPTP